MVYLIACRSMKLEQEFRLAAAADKGLDAGGNVPPIPISGALAHG
jgi:hypothetical protein